MSSALKTTLRNRSAGREPRGDGNVAFVEGKTPMEGASYDPPGYRDGDSTVENPRTFVGPEARAAQLPADFTSRLQHLLEMVREARNRGELTLREESVVADLRSSLRAILGDDAQR
jgi:hypothetical protein